MAQGVYSHQATSTLVKPYPPGCHKGSYVEGWGFTRGTYFSRPAAPPPSTVHTQYWGGVGFTR